MTMIAFAAERTSATVIADSLGYTLGGRHLSTHSKLNVLDEIGAVLAGSGISSFSGAWVTAAREELACEVSDFDEFTGKAAPLLQDLWDDFLVAREDAGVRGEPHPTTEFVIGYSEREQRFKAYGYHSGFNFQPIDVPAHVQPAPQTALSMFEADTLEDLLRKSGTDTAILDQWPSQPFRPPTSRNGWARLAEKVRNTRAVQPGGSGFVTIIGGDVVQARLTRDGITTSVIHTFDDDGSDFRQMMAASLHPTSQEAPCWWCDSGARFIDCCLTDRHAGQPCPCGSADIFDDCCSLHAQAPVPS